MSRAIDAMRGQRSVFTTWRHAAYPALTYALSIGSDRGFEADDFGPEIIGRRAEIDNESAHRRQAANRIRQFIEPKRTAFDQRSNVLRTVFDEGSARMSRNRPVRTQASHQPRTGFDDLSVELTARGDGRVHYAGLNRHIEPP